MLAYIFNDGHFYIEDVYYRIFAYTLTDKSIVFSIVLKRYS